MQKDDFFRFVRLLRKKSSGANRGFSLIEALAAIAVLAVGSGVYLSSSNMKTHDQLRVQQAATQMKTISAAAAQYARTNASTLLSLTTPGSATGYSVSLSALEAAGYLPTGYLATNPWGQTVGVEYYQPVAGTLATIVYTSGGTSIDGRNLVMAAKLQGSQGGYVPTSELQTTYAGQGICSGSCVQGAGNAWQFPMSTFSVPSTSGHLVTYSSLNNQSLVHDTLYRSAVPGNPNANTMQTNINMNGNNINNLNDLLNVNDIQTYNLTSPNGTVNMDGNSLSSGSINTNGQPIYAGNGWGHDAWGTWMPPCPTYQSEYAYWKGECGCYEWVLACFTGIYANGMGVMDRIVSQGNGEGSSGSGATTAGMPWIGGWGQQWTP